jgi:hypothetical protein
MHLGSREEGQLFNREPTYIATFYKRVSSLII